MFLRRAAPRHDAHVPLFLPDPAALLVGLPSLTAGYIVFGIVGFGTTLVALPLMAHG
jgi:hypothetical protein